MIGILESFPKNSAKDGGENIDSKRGQHSTLSCDGLCHNQSHYLRYPVDDAFDAKTYFR